MLLDRIQAHLEAIYGVRCELKVSDHLVDAAAARALGGSGRHEQLLVHEAEDALELALYVDPTLLAKVERSSPLEELPAFCEATEGVSHFLYLTRAAALDRTVSLLELEAQGEIDKFVSCALWSWWRGGAGALLERLFDRVQYRPGLSDDERRRYEEANRMAKGYCRRLVELFTARRMDLLLAELRETYRLGGKAKRLRLSGG